MITTMINDIHVPSKYYDIKDRHHKPLSKNRRIRKKQLKKRNAIYLANKILADALDSQIVSALLPDPVDIFAPSYHLPKEGT